MIEPKPYRLHNTIQYYEWGSKNENAFIPKLLGIETEKDLPYAELWIGAHPKAPSKLELNNREWDLNVLIEKYPTEILGSEVAKKFNNRLPFLLKVLSTEKALSIQAHPNKELASTLHKRDPKNYPDDNHKPEIAIAIDHLDAIVGFRVGREIIELVEKFDVLKNLIKKKQINFSQNNDRAIAELYSALLTLNKAELTVLIEGMRDQILNSNSKTKSEIIFLEQYENFGVDAGLVSILLFNLIELNQDEAIFTGAGVPHAYLKGNIIECMANSDNVVRAGLTAKFKDVDTLLNMIDYKNKNMNVLQPGNKNEKFYKVPVDEFELYSFLFKPVERKIINKAGIMIGLLLEGSLTLQSNGNKEEFEKGSSFLIPAIVDKLEILSEKESKLILVLVSNT